LQDIIKHSDLSIIGASEGKKKEQWRRIEEIMA
jgi:hypothetical protein